MSIKNKEIYLKDNQKAVITAFFIAHKHQYDHTHKHAYVHVDIYAHAW